MKLMDKVLNHINRHKMLGEYIVKSPIKIEGNNKCFCFEVEWEDCYNVEVGKTIYFYLNNDNGDQVDGKYIYEVNEGIVELFYNEVLVNNKFK
jgi:hypothetical protein